MKGKYRRVRFWCDTCDGALLAPGEKCPNCGERQTGQKIKKKDALREEMKINGWEE